METQQGPCLMVGPGTSNGKRKCGTKGGGVPCPTASIDQSGGRETKVESASSFLLFFFSFSFLLAVERTGRSAHLHVPVRDDGRHVPGGEQRLVPRGAGTLLRRQAARVAAPASRRIPQDADPPRPTSPTRRKAPASAVFFFKMQFPFVDFPVSLTRTLTLVWRRSRGIRSSRRRPC